MITLESLAPREATTVADVLNWDVGDRVFGRYMIERSTRGGMGLIFVCREQHSDVRCVLKIPNLPLNAIWTRPGGFAGPVRGEVEAWSRIGSHRNVVQFSHIEQFVFLETFDHRAEARAESAGVDVSKKRRHRDVRFEPFVSWTLPSFVIDYGGPHTLADCIRDSTFATLDEKVDVLAQVAIGMEHAVNCGVLAHLDLKPTNILIDEELTPRVTDFGLAQLSSICLPVGSVPRSLFSTQTMGSSEEHWIGTPMYMSPEQWTGMIDCDQRSDIFAFGLTAIELFAGRHPFGQVSSYGEIREAHERLQATVHAVDAPPSVQEILSKCVAVRPGERFQSWNDLIAALPRAAVTQAYSNADACMPDGAKLLRSAIAARDERTLVRAMAETHASMEDSRTYRVASITLALVRRQYASAAFRAAALSLTRRLKHTDLDTQSQNELRRGRALIGQRVAQVAVPGSFFGVFILLGAIGGGGDDAAEGYSFCAGYVALVLYVIFARAFRRTVDYWRIRGDCPNCGDPIKDMTPRARRSSPAAGYVGDLELEQIHICPTCSYHRGILGQARLKKNTQFDGYEFMGVRCSRVRRGPHRTTAPTVSLGGSSVAP